MLKRLQHHINVQIQRLLDKMIYATLIFLVCGFGLIFVYATTRNAAYLWLLWIAGLAYATMYFIDAAKFGGIVKKLDQESLSGSIYLSKSYFNF